MSEIEAAAAETSAEKKEVISTEEPQSVPDSEKEISPESDKEEMPKKIAELSLEDQKHFMASYKMLASLDKRDRYKCI